MNRLLFLLISTSLWGQTLFAQMPVGGNSLQLPPSTPTAIRQSQAVITSLQRQAKRVLALPARYHKRASGRAMSMTLKNIAIDSSLLWFHLTLYNRSHVRFHPAYCRFVIRDWQHSKQAAVQSVEVSPYRRPRIGIVGYRHPYELVLPFVPFTIGPHQRLLVQVGEARSGRQLQLVLGERFILSATYLPK